MKKIFAATYGTILFTSLMFSGCSSEEPKEPPAKDSTTKAIQTAADKAHAAINKTATASQTLAEKAEEIKDTARKAASDMSATLQKSEARNMEKSAETPATPPETHK